MNSPQPELFADLVRRLYLERVSSVVEVELPTERRKLFFRDGELHLHPLEKMAEHLAPYLKAMGPGTRSVDVPELCAAADKLVEELGVHPGITARAMTHQDLPPQLIGPLPTVYFVLGLATRGCDEGDLLERLEGAGAVYRTRDDSPALHQLPGLEADMQQAMVALAQPMAVSEVLRGADRLPMLRGMAKLRSVGLVVREIDEGLQVVTAKILKRFLARVGEGLEDDPIELKPEEHRGKVGDLMRDMASFSHYQILDVSTRANEEEIMLAYTRLARVVHPLHAETIDLVGREGALEVLFERLTEAYLVLSDPKRRSSYNNLAGIQVEVNIDPDQRREEKRHLAEQSYRRAAALINRMDFSRAVDLLKEAARLDPQPEYLARLAQIQAKNPKWYRHAVQSYEQAIELRADDAGLHAGFAEVLEAMGRVDEARNQYRRTIELMPDHVPAQQGLERLGK